MKKILIIILISVFFWPLLSRAVVLKDDYPRLANYFLKWEISDTEALELAKWDVLILDMEVQENSRDQLIKIRELNPRIIILAYITSQEILDNINEYNQAYVRQDLDRGLFDGWWLRDAQGYKVSNWPNTSMLNLSDGALPDAKGERFNDYLPEFVVNKLKSTGLWDGVFYDNTWGELSWVSNKNLDLNNDGQAESAATADRLWAEGFKKMLAKTRALAGRDFIIIGNGRVYEGYQTILNGVMLENFPSAWENGGTWSGSMQTYLKLPTLNAYPQISIINIYDKNQQNYRRMRYGLSSTLLGDGFYSHDYDVTSPGQTWWYDEYSVNLGTPRSSAYNLLAAPGVGGNWSSGLWRRDFKNGVAIVNSTAKKQVYVFAQEEFEKIKGVQDKIINNGQKINYLSLEPQDGILLWKRSTLITDSAFVNGYFYRVYNLGGVKQGNGFFSYVGAYPGEAEVIISSSDNNKKNMNLSGASGQVGIYQNGKKIKTLVPYGNLYKKSLSLAAPLKDAYWPNIIVGAGIGGGPQVSVFTGDGRLKYSFFAYDKNLRGGVNVAAGDFNGDGQIEIATAPGPGTEPRIKIFSLSGRLENNFLAYDSKFKGGVNVAAGDFNGDGRQEIATSPVSAGGPQVRIFNSNGRVLGSFFAYDQSYHGGINVAASDINADGRAEILVGLKNFY
ncbi:MAG: putative glycoside hydrolase [Patescibacteria group bacterium]|jgi:hypothetical protein